mmetsp:Transcript_26232/g.61295  ORF Transcript_26232/g.61295 Transcript_26232/m.61295 type:complete len:356 (-) Transcript_26232:336-1403(-)
MRRQKVGCLDPQHGRVERGEGGHDSLLLRRGLPILGDLEPPQNKDLVRMEQDIILEDVDDPSQNIIGRLVRCCRGGGTTTGPTAAAAIGCCRGLLRPAQPIQQPPDEAGLGIVIHVEEPGRPPLRRRGGPVRIEQIQRRQGRGRHGGTDGRTGRMRPGGPVEEAARLPDGPIGQSLDVQVDHLHLRLQQWIDRRRPGGIRPGCCGQGGRERIVAGPRGDEIEQLDQARRGAVDVGPVQRPVDVAGQRRQRPPHGAHLVAGTCIPRLLFFWSSSSRCCTFSLQCACATRTRRLQLGTRRQALGQARQGPHQLVQLLGPGLHVQDLVGAADQLAVAAGQDEAELGLLGLGILRRPPV